MSARGSERRRGRFPHDLLSPPGFEGFFDEQIRLVDVELARLTETLEPNADQDG